VRCVQAEVFDVAVDLRKSSPNFGKWVGVRLSAENKRQFWIPPKLAHGFLTLSEPAEFLYKTTDYYASEHERMILWDDPDLAIDWPLTEFPALSTKDQVGRVFREAEIFEWLTFFVSRFLRQKSINKMRLSSQQVETLKRPD